MDPSQIAQIISTVGFPIVAAGGLFWYLVKENRETRAVVENNTIMVQKVLEHIKEEERKYE